MTRLKPGEYQKMTPEQKKEHNKELRLRWLSKPGNLELVKNANKKYLQQYWERKKNTPVERVCKQCGKTVFLTGCKTICDECRSIPSKTAAKKQARNERREKRLDRNSKIIAMATSTNKTQKEIAMEIGTSQELVSKVLRNNHIKRAADGKTENLGK